MIGGLPDRLRALLHDPIIKNTRIPAPDSKVFLVTLCRRLFGTVERRIYLYLEQCASVWVGVTDVKRGVWGLNLCMLYVDCNMTPNHLNDSLVIITVCRCGELKPGSL